MATLSRVDNAHAVFLVQTTLQNCNRLFALITIYPEDTDEQICEKASVGLGSEFLHNGKLCLAFVRNCAVGKDKHILADLEAYEQGMEVTRKIFP